MLTTEELCAELQDCHLTSEPAERLRELDAYVSAADHNEVGRESVEFERFDMRQRVSIGETRDVWGRRAGAEIW